MDTFSARELAYLRTQRLGRLATVDGTGTPQNSPVGFRVSDDGTVRIGGLQLGASRKFRNVQRDDRVSLVVDDVVSVSPWRVRAVEIRGRADALSDVEPLAPGMSRQEIRIHPERIVSWGLDGDGP